MVQRYARHMLEKNDTDFVNCLSVVVVSPFAQKANNEDQAN